MPALRRRRHATRLRRCAQNATTAFKEGDIRKAWRPMTKGCKIVPAGCYCFHVTGSPEKALRPADSWRTSRDFEAAQLMKAN
eukprot:7378825-Prymnesium_polylepis.2